MHFIWRNFLFCTKFWNYVLEYDITYLSNILQDYNGFKSSTMLTIYHMFCICPSKYICVVPLFVLSQLIDLYSLFICTCYLHLNFDTTLSNLNIFYHWKQTTTLCTLCTLYDLDSVRYRLNSVRNVYNMNSELWTMYNSIQVLKLW